MVVEYFYSAARQERVTHIESDLIGARLPAQTRCYIRQLDTEYWTAGRIGERDGEEYEVNLPDRESVWLHQSHIYVRCLAESDEDPVESLILKSIETAWFHERRVALMRELIRQRAGTRGMSALSSARIELFPHQVEVVRRVLEDPRQRYLLADEVGLGKTIEAGILIRQFLTDLDEGEVLVVVPRLLQEQWQRELETRVDVVGGGRVEIVSFGDVPHLQDDADFDMLVIDEAHRVASLAASEVSGDRTTFDAVRRLAHRVPRLLLLSATPAANHESQFLAMLHLLEPQHYRLDDVAAFQARVAARAEIGQKLLTLTDDSRPFILKLTINGLLALFPDDGCLRALSETLYQQIGTAPNDSESRVPLIRAIRTHVSETYRLHRRMIRNRRDTLSDAVLERSRAELRVHHDQSDATRDVEDALEDWRSLAAIHSQTAAHESGSRSTTLATIFMALVESASNGPENLLACVRHRLRIADPTARALLAGSLSEGAIAEVESAPFFSEEEAVLVHLAACAEAQVRDQPRCAVLAKVLRGLREEAGRFAPAKTLVFASAHATAASVFERISSALGRNVVSRHLEGMSRTEVEAEVERFRDNHDCFVLVCDRSGEEGRNFQFAKHLVHYDLPWNPNRLEQRIGRADRISRVRDLTMHVILGRPDSSALSDQWYQVLKDGFGVFHNSIASLQFYIDAKMPPVWNSAFVGGVDALAAQTAMMAREIDEERLKIDEQAAIDEIDAQATNAREFFDAIESADSREEPLREAVDSWLTDVLKFERHDSALVPRVIRYTAPRGVLVPEDLLRSHFAAHLNKPGTFSRTTASREPGVVLHRLGDGLVDALSRYISWDDRGRVFAIWRHESDWDPREGGEWIGFRFTFVVRADTRKARAALATFSRERGLSFEALARRADALCPPRSEALFVDIGFSEVSDQSLLARLKRPFAKAENGGSDYNLTKHRLGLIDSVIPAEVWEATCRKARQTAERCLTDRDGFRVRYDGLATTAERKLSLAVEQLAARERFQDTEVTPGLQPHEAELERTIAVALVDGIRNPQVSLDSIGLIVLSGRTPAVSDSGLRSAAPYAR